MDFSLIERHPWITLGTIAGGAFLLYLLLRRRSGGSASTGGGYPGGVVVQQSGDTAATQAANVAMYQTQAALQYAGIQSGAQVQIAGLSAGVQNRSTDAALTLGLAQTQAELVYGVGAQSSSVDIARIQAELQQHYIDAIVGAYSGGMHTPTSPTPIQQNPAAPSSPTYIPPSPNDIIMQPVPVTYNQSTPTSYDVTTPTYTQNGYAVSLVTPGAAPLPGGAPVATGFYVEQCDPKDVACVNRNQNRSIAWEDTVNQSQTVNNRNQCLANAQLSVGKPNYDALVAACG